MATTSTRGALSALGDALWSFDAPTGLVSKAHIYIGSKGDYYPLVDDRLLQLDELT